MLFALTYCVAIGITSNIKVLNYKKKSIKKILNNKCPRIEPRGTPKLISCQLLSDEFIFVRFLFDT